MDIYQSTTAYLTKFPGFTAESGVPTPQAMKTAMETLVELGEKSTMPADGKLVHLDQVVAELAKQTPASAVIFNQEIVDNPDRQSLAKVLETGLAAIEKQSPETWKHLLNHTSLTMLYYEQQHSVEHGSPIAANNNLAPDTQNELLTLLTGALCHDMGKLAIDPQLLHKSSRIAPDRMQIAISGYDALVPDYPEKSHDLLFMDEANNGKILFADKNKNVEHTAPGMILDVGKDFSRSEASLTDAAAQQQHNAIWDRIQQKASQYIVPSQPEAWLNQAEENTLTMAKRGTVTDLEKAVIESHDPMSEMFMKAAPLPENLRGAADIVNMDRFRHADKSNSGPNDRLATVLHVTDELEALTADRSYRKSFTPDVAMHVLEADATKENVGLDIVNNIKTNGTLEAFKQKYAIQHPTAGPDNPPYQPGFWANLLDSVSPKSWAERLNFGSSPKQKDAPVPLAMNQNGTPFFAR